MFYSWRGAEQRYFYRVAVPLEVRQQEKTRARTESINCDDDNDGIPGELDVVFTKESNPPTPRTNSRDNSLNRNKRSKTHRPQQLSDISVDMLFVPGADDHDEPTVEETPLLPPRHASLLSSQNTTFKPWFH